MINGIVFFNSQGTFLLSPYLNLIPLETATMTFFHKHLNTRCVLITIKLILLEKRIIAVSRYQELEF